MVFFKVRPLQFKADLKRSPADLRDWLMAFSRGNARTAMQLVRA